MDTEKNGEVLDASETPRQEEAVMEKEVVSKVETPEKSTEPEKPPAADEETEQLAVDSHDTEVTNPKETEESTVTLSEEKTQVEVEDNLPKETSETESVPVEVAPAEPDESSEKISEPESIQPEQQPVPEKKPEPLPMQTPLAESAAVPEPDELPESVPEAKLPEQTLPESATLQQPVETEPPKQEEKAPEQADTEAEVKTAMETGAEEAVKAENNDVAEEQPAAAAAAAVVETVLVAEVSSEKPAEAEPPAETENVKPAEDEKKVEPEKPVESATPKEAEPEAEVVKSEQNDTEPEQEEDPVPASSSLSFALLEREQTKDALLTSRTLVVLRGLPGSGKSFLARAIADAYKDHCSVVCADEYGVKPETPDSSADGYKALDEAVVACCSAGTASSVMIVVDDTNHTQDRLTRMGEIAREHHLVAVFLEPRTEWSRDLTQLNKKSRRGLEEAQMKAMHSQLEEMSLPLFYGWFLLSPVQEKIRCTSMDFLKTLDTLEAFKKHVADFNGKAEKEVDLEQYFKTKQNLHCTTKFCDRGKAKGAQEYAQNPAVRDFYGSAFELSLSALFVTPRTFGARVSLTEEQLLLWPTDAEKEAESDVPGAASLPLGSRAHVTLGCAEGFQPVQTGLDLLQILVLQQEGQQGEPVEEMELGSLTYYGEGRWLLNLREPICAPACFSSSYRSKEAGSTKKEPEKKKKQKCTIL